MILAGAEWAWRRLKGGLNARLPTVAGGRFARLCRPGSICFLLTERCNARCLHCDIWQSRGKEDLTPIDDWKRVLRELRSWLGPTNIVFTGGEALLNPRALDLVRYAVSCGFLLEVLTNGYSPDQGKIEALALAGPWRITVSLDGMESVHSKIRGRDDFFEVTCRSLRTLMETKARRNLKFRILLKTVIMEHNLDDLIEVARFAERNRIEVFFQPIEQNYKRPWDPFWFATSGNWPRDTGKAIARIRELAALKRAGAPIANAEQHFEAMVRYFEDPVNFGLVTRAHVVGKGAPPCCAATTLQFQANGDVTVCANRPPIGNIRRTPVRELWKVRARVWEKGCCLREPVPAPPPKADRVGAPSGISGGDEGA